MSNKIESIVKVISIFMAVISVAVIGLMLLMSHILSTDLVKKGLIDDITIQDGNLIFSIKEGYVYSASISTGGYEDRKDVFDKEYVKKISSIQIDDYQSIIEDGRRYSLLLYNYEHGKPYFSGFEFCTIGDTVMYGKNIKKCHDDGLR